MNDKETSDAQPDYSAYADILDASNAVLDAAAEAGDAGATYRALEAKRRATEEWFPDMIKPDSEIK